MDPERVRRARLESGLSLAQLAGDEVSRTFIHFVERGQSRPSQAVLALIARRTRKPISYFLAQPGRDSGSDLAGELTRVANLVRKFGSGNRLTSTEREAIKLIEVTLRQAARLTKSVQSNSWKRSKHS